MLQATALRAIGQPHVPDFTDPLGLMSHCHRKIEGYLAGLLASIEILDGGRSEKLAEAFRIIDAAREHFAVRGPRHTEDEEVSLFPRLREFGGQEAAEALGALDELEAGHRTAEAAHAEFDALIDRLPRDGSAPRAEIGRLKNVVAVLCDIYPPHICIEDEVIFPLAARVLPSRVLLQIGEEMRARRRELLLMMQGGMTAGVAITARR
jgi:hemerythrin-like domain-containing protein